jgi:hypothetical protein
MAGAGDWDTTIEKLIAATEDTREVIREAHGVSRDLRQLIAEARKMIASDVEAALKKQLITSVREAMDQVGSATQEAMDAAVLRVNAKFDELAALLTGTDAKSRRLGKPPLEDLIRAAAAVPPAFQQRTHLPGVRQETG